MSRALRFALIACFALGGILLFLLASASTNSRLLERFYPILFGISVVIVVVMFGFVVALFRRVRRRTRAGVFGTRLMTKLAISFSVIGIVPGVLIYLVSSQFLAKSFDAWFDVRVDRALESGLNLGRTSIDALLAELSEKARKMAPELGSGSDSLSKDLNRLRESYGLDEAIVISNYGRIMAAAGSSFSKLMPDGPPQHLLAQARVTRHLAWIESPDLGVGQTSSTIRLKVMTEVLPSWTSVGARGDEARWLMIVQSVPESLSSNAIAVQEGFQEYQELSLARSGLRKIFAAVLTLTLLLALFSALSAALLLSGWLAGPLRKLSKATKQVAEGNFSPLRESGQRDELGVLIQSFNAMTRQLHDARANLVNQQRALERQKVFLEQVLSNLSAGVLVLDRDDRLTTANRGANEILGAKDAHLASSVVSLQPRLTLDELPGLGAQAPTLRELFADLDRSPAPWINQRRWQKELTVQRLDGQTIVLLVRGTTLPDPDGGHVLVFDDVTELLAAQRSVAWAEVARRLAHEIKNPLTPIQLSAERLQRRLADRLFGEDVEILNRATGMIVTQVAALKRMVDEFRDYARMPPAKLVALDLNQIVEDVLTLYPVVEGRAPIAVTFAPSAPQIMGDATQLMQVIHNLVLNAQDALAGRPDAAVTVRTETVLGADSTPVAVRLLVADNGPGFPPETLPRAFEPYVTTKAKGTGLGLAIVKKIVDEHGARIGLINRCDERKVVCGAEVSITFAQLAQDEASTTSLSGGSSNSELENRA